MEGDKVVAVVKRYECMFTKDVNKKLKKWVDGYLTVHHLNSKLVLYEGDAVVAQTFYRPPPKARDSRVNGGQGLLAEFRVPEGEQIKLEDMSFLVEVGEFKEATETNIAQLNKTSRDLKRQKREETRQWAEEMDDMDDNSQGVGSSSSAAAAAPKSSTLRGTGRPMIGSLLPRATATLRAGSGRGISSPFRPPSIGGVSIEARYQRDLNSPVLAAAPRFRHRDQDDGEEEDTPRRRGPKVWHQPPVRTHQTLPTAAARTVYVQQQQQSSSSASYGTPTAGASFKRKLGLGPEQSNKRVRTLVEKEWNVPQIKYIPVGPAKRGWFRPGAVQNAEASSEEDDEEEEEPEEEQQSEDEEPEEFVEYERDSDDASQIDIALLDSMAGNVQLKMRKAAGLDEPESDEEEEDEEELRFSDMLGMEDELDDEESQALEHGASMAVEAPWGTDALIEEEPESELQEEQQEELQPEEEDELEEEEVVPSGAASIAEDPETSGVSEEERKRTKPWE